MSIKREGGAFVIALGSLEHLCLLLAAWVVFQVFIFLFLCFYFIVLYMPGPLAATSSSTLATLPTFLLTCLV
jgi:hypothetical protein